MPTCEKCGLTYAEDDQSDRRYHNKRHDVYVNGPKVDLQDGVHLLSPGDPLRHRKAAEQAARVFSLEMKYDFPAYCATDRSDFANNGTRAVVYVMAGRLVGLLVHREWRCCSYLRVSSEKVKARPETRCLCLDIVWVSATTRRRGIGRRLVSTFLENLGDLPLAVLTPISDAGMALLSSFRLTGFWIR